MINGKTFLYTNKDGEDIYATEYNNNYQLIDPTDGKAYTGFKKHPEKINKEGRPPMTSDEKKIAAEERKLKKKIEEALEERVDDAMAVLDNLIDKAKDPEASAKDIALFMTYVMPTADVRERADAVRNQRVTIQGQDVSKDDLLAGLDIINILNDEPIKK